MLINVYPGLDDGYKTAICINRGASIMGREDRKQTLPQLTSHLHRCCC